MTSPAPACASDASLDENRIPFFFGPASLLIPFLIFALLSVYLFVVLKVFDLMALAGAGLTALVAGALLTKKPMRYWKAVLEGAASPMTATVLLLLMAAGVFSAMMKAARARRSPRRLHGRRHCRNAAAHSSRFSHFIAFGHSHRQLHFHDSGCIPHLFAFRRCARLRCAADGRRILSGAIFGDNLAPVSDVAIISAMTQTDKFGKPLDLGRVVKTRFPFAVIALIIALPFYALGGSASEPSAALNAAADPMRLLMLIPVVLLIFIAIKMRDALHAVTMATVAGLIIGLLTGVIEPSQIVRVENGSISGILTGGIANVSGIMLMCLALFGFTGVIEHAGLADATANFLTNENQSPRRAEVTLAVATVFISTCLAAVTSVAVALAGQLADRLLRRSIDPYRRAYLLAGFANSIPVILPFSAFSLITLSAASALGDPTLTPFSLMTATFYPIALFVVFSVSIATGIGRPKISEEPQSSDKA